MEKQEKITQLTRELLNLIIRFFKPYEIKDDMMTIPKNIKKLGLKVNSLNYLSTVLALLFAFMLKATNLMIQYRFILLGIIFFLLYRGQNIIREAFYLMKASNSRKFDLIFEDEIVYRASQIIGKTGNKVMQYDSANCFYKVMSNETMLNTLRNYLNNYWRMQVEHFFDICEMFSVIAMLVVAVITNNTIDKIILIPLITFFSLISFISSAYISLNSGSFYKKQRTIDNEQRTIVNDLLRVPNVVSRDLEMRIQRFQQSILHSNKNIADFYQKRNFSIWITTILETMSQYGIIAVYLFGIKWDSITLVTITEITAELIIIETALGYIGRIVNTINRHNEKIITLEKEEPDLYLILDVYHQESNRLSKPKEINQIDINPFSIRYIEESENDKPFTLLSNEKINLNKGEIGVLYGPSGSGKSTFMKLLTERIRVKKSTDVPSTSRCLFYDEKLSFGTMSIYDELFCCSDNPDIIKMQNILENLHLWFEIKANCFDVWQWMKEKKFEQALSNGQKQRLILAKILYWLDEDIDVLVLDECTSGLDDRSEDDSTADAEKILEYVVRYANQDRKRIIIIATHQNIDGFKDRLSDEFTFKDFQFIRNGDYNLISQI